MFAMSKYIVLAAGIAVAALLVGHAAAQDRDRSMATVAEIPLTGDDGQRVPNHAVKLLGRSTNSTMAELIAKAKRQKLELRLAPVPGTTIEHRHRDAR